MASLKQLYEAQSSLVAYWPLIERTKNGVRKIWLDNVAPNGPEQTGGQFIGTQATAEGPFFAETVIDFDGSTNYIRLDPFLLKHLVGGASGITVTCRVYADSIPAGTDDNFVFNCPITNNTTGSLTGLNLKIAGTDEVYASTRSQYTDSAQGINSTTSPVSVATWYQLTYKVDFSADDAWVRLGTTEIAVNTALSYGATTFTQSYGTNASPSHIGTGSVADDDYDTTPAGADCFDGRICHVAIFTEALSDTICDTFANATSGYFNTPVTSVNDAIDTLVPDHWWKLNETSGTTATDSGYAASTKNGTYAGTPTYNVISAGSPDGDGFIQLDGVDDQVDTIGAAADWSNLHYDGQSATVVGFFKLDDAANNSTNIIFGTDDSANYHGATLFVDTRTSLAYVKGEPSFVASWVYRASAAEAWNTHIDITADTDWHMVVFRKSDNDIRVWIDDAFSDLRFGGGQQYQNNNIMSTSAARYPLHFGTNGGGGGWFEGQLAHIALWKRALSYSEIKSVWNAFQYGTATLSLTLRDSGGSPKASLSGLYWWYYPDAPSAMADGGQTAAAWGSGASTNAQGVFSVTSVTGPGVVPGTGFIIITDSDGTPGNANVVAATPITLT